MNYLKKNLMIVGVIAITSCTENPKGRQNKPSKPESKQQIDSLNQEPSYESEIDDSIISVENGEASSSSDKKVKKAGKHPVSLQWIGWDNRGSVNIAPMDDEWYSIKGSQKNKAGDYLTIDGKIKRTGNKELEFDGEIVTKVSHNNDGEPCIKTGKQIFYGKGDRTYFRLQDMTNCEGGMLVDYVDIYPGTSSL